MIVNGSDGGYLRSFNLQFARPDCDGVAYRWEDGKIGRVGGSSFRPWGSSTPFRHLRFSKRLSMNLRYQRIGPDYGGTLSPDESRSNLGVK